MQSVCGSEFNRTQVIFKLVTIEPCSVLESVRVGREQVNLLSREIELSDQVIYGLSQDEQFYMMVTTTLLSKHKIHKHLENNIFFLFDNKV